MENNKEKSFTDNNGTSKVLFESDSRPLGGDFSNNNYVIANHITSKSKPKTRVLSKEINMPRTTNIGIGSNGFAGVITLASIIAIAGVIVAYLTLRY